MKNTNTRLALTVLCAGSQEGDSGGGGRSGGGWVGWMGHRCDPRDFDF